MLIWQHKDGVANYSIFARLDACQTRGEVPDAQFGEKIVRNCAEFVQSAGSILGAQPSL